MFWCRYFSKFLFFSVFVILSCLNKSYATNGAKIVAFVNNDVITDVDVNEFEKNLCKIETRFKCGSRESKYISLHSLVESTLKLEHFKQIADITENKTINKNFSSYKEQVLKKMKTSKKDISVTFENYLYAEYLWGIMVSSQAHNEKISESELNDFMKNKKISDAKIAKEMLLNDKINNISQKTMNEIKQFYYVEIKEL